IEAAEPERGKAEQKAGDEADDAGDRNRRPIRDAELRHKDRGSVPADREERAVAERDLPVEPGQNVEAKKRDGEDQHLGALVEAIARGEERNGEGDDHDRGRDDRSDAPVPPRHRHTRATRRRPNRPEGRQTRTATMIASATESFTSGPTT